MTLDDLNAAVARVPALPRVQYKAGDYAERWLAKKHADGGVHEPGTIAAFLAVTEHYDCRVIWDVGALHGYFALLAKQLVPGADVTAFEANPGYFVGLKANVGGDITCVQAVVSDETVDGRLVWFNCFNLFEKPDGGWEGLASIPGAMKDRYRGWHRGEFTTLDDYCDFGLKAMPDLVKIDVEAYQAKAVRGMRWLIANRRPATIIELHDPEKTERMDTTNRETVQPFYDAGYRGFWCGNFRDADAVFEEVTAMGPQHERLSIMVFVP